MGGGGDKISCSGGVVVTKGTDGEVVRRPQVS